MPMEIGECFNDRLNRYKNDLYPGHYLFGIPELEKIGYNIRFSSPENRMKITNAFSVYKYMVNYTLKIIRDIRFIDLIYSPYPNFLDFIIYLRAIKIFPKKIVIYQHCTITKNKGFFSYYIRQKLYYKGVDRLIFFDNKTAFDSIKTGLVKKKQIFVVNWGPDTEQYKRILDKHEKNDVTKNIKFISTGKDSRDFDLMFDAFSGLNAKFELYLTDSDLVAKYINKTCNINVHHLEASKDSPQIALKATIDSDVSVVICKPTRPTSNGYTALCEAMGLGKPVILTKNPYIPIDVEKEGFGITVPVNDVIALRNAINIFYNNPELVREYSKNARMYADRHCNTIILGNQLDILFKNL
jgi:glycosyltransferase involved in cell wall biosynthesis